MRSISVLCTFRNASGTLKDTIVSLKSQTISEFSCILVNDGSSDNGADIARAAIADDPRFIIVDNPIPGRGHALNLGISLSHTDYFAILDADDIAHPEWLERMTQVSEDVAAIGCEAIIFGANELPGWHSIPQAPTAPVIVTKRLIKNNPISHSGCTFTKDAVLSVGGYDASRKSQFDYDLYVRLVEQGQAIARLDLPLVGHRVHSGQSFESAKHLDYVWRSVQVQLRAISILDPRPTSYVWPLARIVWATLPRRGRMRFRRKRPIG